MGSPAVGRAMGITERQLVELGRLLSRASVGPDEGEDRPRRGLASSSLEGREGGAHRGSLSGVARIVVIGAAGSGKTTLARAAAAKLGLTSIDLDDLFWEPGWRHVDRETLRERLDVETASTDWIVAGNYTSHVRDLLWQRATTLVWLDLPRRTSFRRVVMRTFKDAVRRRELWPGCRQTFRAPFETRLFQLAWEQPAKFKDRYEGFLAEPGSAHLEVVRLTSTREVAEWLRSIPVATR